MKTIRQPTEPKFDPIVITLETKEEAYLMYHMLNCPQWRVLSDYYEHVLDKVPPIELKEQMANVFKECLSNKE